MENNTNIMELFSKAAMLMHRYQYHGGRERGIFQNPHRGQGRILSVLKMQPEISQKELSYLLDMSNQSLSELLSKLEKSGFVTRTQSETDRRVMNVKLTESGMDAAKQTEQQKLDGEEFFDCLTEEERGNIVHCLNKIINEFENKMAEQGFDCSWSYGDFRDGITPEIMAGLRERDIFDGRGFGKGNFGHGRGFETFGIGGAQPVRPRPEPPTPNTLHAHSDEDAPARD